ncbi:MAG: ATP-binding cassette domain-containing protein [Acidobacteriota bacterium]|nr:ATP-binding cassette domain-containing protein [Acidobacteriota bacterium]
MKGVGLPTDEEFRSRYPSQISVGQAQRVLIAMAVMHSSSLLIADKPTRALDAVTQSEILNLFLKLNHQLRVAVLYISHDLQSVASICHRIAILHEGTIVESGTTDALLTHPAHPYTQQLLACVQWLRPASPPLPDLYLVPPCVDGERPGQKSPGEIPRGKHQLYRWKRLTGHLGRLFCSLLRGMDHRAAAD